jgi:hypothetical protein
MSVNDQQERLQAILQPAPLAATLFPPNSRYAGLETAVWDAGGDRPIIYLRRRFVPAPERLGVRGEHVVAASERPDQIAAEELGDPELAWRLADANRVLHPDELTAEVGRRLRVPPPIGLLGVADE